MRLLPKRHLDPLDTRGPLRVMFVITTMPVGGAETLLVNLIRRMDRARFRPELCCLKHFGPLGDVLAKEVPAYERLIDHKYDVAVWGRLAGLFSDRRIDAVVTVGTGGDKMFWGRLAALRAGVPVILSALHSTGLPDHVEFPNRLLAPWTDGFIGVAKAHALYLSENEGCPAHKVFVVPNGVDVEAFRPRSTNPRKRASLNLVPDAPVAGIVAALRPEKNHTMFVEAAARVLERLPKARFLIVGEGPERTRIETLARERNVAHAVRLLGSRSDVPELLAEMNVVALSSHMEANPVSLLEAMASGKPVVAPRVGSIPESVEDGTSGYLFPAGDVDQLADRMLYLLTETDQARQMGETGRRAVETHWSLERMVDGYQDLIQSIYRAKSERGRTQSQSSPIAREAAQEAAGELQICAGVQEPELDETPTPV